MIPRIPENAWLDLVTIIGVPPRDPNDNDDDNDIAEDEEDENDDLDPAVIREPDE
jgi:Arc/MetJ-type ribon-helix-helix transcriptional regulator